MGALDLVLGPMVIGTAVSVFLCGILVTQIYSYFTRYPNDPRWMKMMAAYFLLSDLFHTGVEVAIVYNYTVTLFGNIPAILVANWLFAMIPVLSVCISSVAQGFFAWRVGRLTRLHFLGWLIGLLAVVQFLCGIGVTIAVTIVKDFLQFQKFQGLVIPWLACSVACDILITSALVWYLQTNKSGIAATDDLVTRLIRLTVQTGAITALWAVLDLIIFLTEDNSLHLLFNFPLAKMYTNSCMSTLNARRSHFDGSTLAGSNNPTGKLGGASGTLSIPTWERGYNTRTETPVPKHISITTTTQIHHDVMGGNTTRNVLSTDPESAFEDYELQQKRPASPDLS